MRFSRVVTVVSLEVDAGELPLRSGEGGKGCVVPGFNVEENCVIFFCVIVISVLGKLRYDRWVVADKEFPDSVVKIVLSAIECRREPESDGRVDVTIDRIRMNNVRINDVQFFNCTGAARDGTSTGRILGDVDVVKNQL